MNNLNIKNGTVIEHSPVFDSTRENTYCQPYGYAV